MTYTISKQFTFSASHVLPDLGAGHPCARLHGHNYVVEVEVRADELDARGFVVDYAELGFIREHIDAYLDHRHLNDVLDFVPTAEKLAAHLGALAHAEFPFGRVSVGVSETPRTWAWWSP